ncbi:MAG: tail fiber domain-containing protein [bacterium]|nr:tail fiber domain-containing protein [bacterium]
MKKMLSFGILITCASLGAHVAADVPRHINYQGMITDLSGNPVSDGSYGATFRVYDVDTGGTPLWQEDQTILLSDGLYSVLLGSVTPLNLPFDEPYWLEIETVIDGETLLVRRPIASAAYAIGVADGAVTGATIADDSITSAHIQDGAITDIDIAASAAIADTKLDVISTPGKVLASAVEDVFLRNDGDTAAGDYNFSSNALVIDSGSGNVGIGTSATTGPKLTVGGDVRMTHGAARAIAVESKATVGGDGDNLSISAGGGGLGTQFPPTPAGDGGTLRLSGGLGGFTGNGRGAPGNVLIAESGGRVGIGTDAPQERLDVSGGVKVGSSSGTAAGIIRWSGTDFEGRTDTEWKSFTAAGNPAGSSGLVQYNNGGIFGGADNLFYGIGSGNVGIRTTSPAYPLDVNGILRASTLLSNSLEVRDAAGDGLILSTTAGDTTFMFETGLNDGYMRYRDDTDSFGFMGMKIGIGTLAPTYPLQVSTAENPAIIAANGALANGPGIKAAFLAERGDGEGAGGMNVTTGGSSTWWAGVGYHQEGYLTEDFIIDRDARVDNGAYVSISRSTGNVGMGTTSPGRPLEVKNDRPFMRLNNGTYSWDVGVDCHEWADYNDFIITSVPQYAVRLMVSGNTGYVGIGTTGPQEKLDVNGAIRIGTTTRNVNGTIRWTGADFEGRTSSGWKSLTAIGTAAGASGQVQFNNGGAFAGASNLVYNAGNGRVGVGTASPSSPLHVVGGSQTYAALTIEGPGSNGAEGRLLFDGNVACSIRNVSDGQMEIDGGYYVLVNSAFGTSIGYSEPIDPWFEPVPQLAVNGNVSIKSREDMGYALYVAGAARSTGGWTTSDRRWKKNIQPLGDSLSSVAKLQGVYYDWNREEYPEMGFPEERQVGLIAQDVEPVLPELVHTDRKGYKSVSYEKLAVVLVEAMKELKAENEALRERLAALEEKAR